jgi:hypothetical protein
VPTPTETPTQTPPPPPPVVYKIVAGPATVANNQISFDFTGDPLPPEVFLTLQSDPAGITFAGDGTCKLRLGDTTAICSTATTTSLVAAPFARTVTTAVGDTFSVTMPLAGTPPKQDTTLTVTLSAPEDVPLQTVTALYDVKEPEPSADVSLTGLPASVAPVNVHDYTVSGVVAGIPDGYSGGARFTLTSPQGSDGPRAELRDSGACTASGDGQALTCSKIANGALDFHLYVKDNSVPTTVGITLAPLDGLVDPVTEDNSATVVLEAYRPAADVKLALTPDLSGNAGKGTVTALVTDAPADGATLTAAFDPAGVKLTTTPPGCTTTSGAVTCPAAPGSTSLAFGLELVERPGHFEDETVSFSAYAPAAYDETNPADNTDTVVIPRSKGSTGGALAQATDIVPTASADPTSPTQQVVADGLADLSTKPATTPEKSPAILLDTTRRSADKPAKGHARNEAKQHPAKPGKAKQDKADSDKAEKGKNEPGKDAKAGKSTIEQVVDALASLLP